MFSKLRFTLLLPLAALLACGSGPSSKSGSTPAYDFNGTWAALTTVEIPGDFPFQGIHGSLQVSNGTVTGTLYTNSSYTISNPYLCPTVSPFTSPTPGTSLTATGTLDADNNLALTFPIEGGTGTLLATLADDPATYAFGTWQVVGGTCPMSVTPMEISGTPTTAYTVPPSGPITAPLSGNWGIGATYASGNSAAGPVTGFGTTLQFSNGTVSGTIVPQGNVTYASCYYILYPAGANPSVAVTGTLNSNDILTLTAPVVGGTATITATLGSNPQTLADGTFQISGGPCAMSPAPMTMAQYAPLTGTYTGTFNVPDQSTNIPDSSDATVTVVLAQSTTANADGAYPLTGSFTITGSCADSGTLVPSTVLGNGITPGSYSPSTGSAALFTATATPTASALEYVWFNSSKCADYWGNLVKQ